MQIVKSELPHTSLRDKSVMIHWSVANVCNFLTTFTLPYLLTKPYANLGPKVGFVYGSISVVLLILLYLYMPEMTNRSLEEVDEMMEARVPAWRTRSQYTPCPSADKGKLTRSSDWKASGLSLRVTQLEDNPQKVDLATCDKLENANHVTPVTSQAK